MTKEVIEKLHAEIDQYASGLSDAEQEALLREVQTLLRSHLHEEDGSPESLADRLELTAAKFEADHPSLAESFIFAINSLNNAGL